VLERNYGHDWHCRTLILLALIALMTVGCANMFRMSSEFAGRGIAVGSLKLVFNSLSEIVELSLQLAWAIREKDGGALGELLGNERFLPAGMDKYEYVELLFQANRTLIIEDDSMGVDLFHGKDQMLTMSVVLPPGAVDSAGVIYSRQKGDSTAFSIRHPETDSLSKSFDQPTLAVVRVFMLVIENDTTRIDNSIFFEKKKERWLITSFEKDLLQLAGGRNNPGKE
jgi:hypothetical protein